MIYVWQRLITGEPDRRAVCQGLMAIKRDKPRVPPSFQNFGALFVCMMALLERCGVLPEFALASLLAFITVVLMTNKHMNDVRCRVLGDQTPTWQLASVRHGFSTLSVVSMLRLRNRGSEQHDRALLAATERLKSTARELGGQVDYVGRAVHVAVKSKQVSDAEVFDVVVLSSWTEAGTAGWTSFRRIVDSEHGWERHVACGYWRNPMRLFGIAVVLVLLRLKCGLYSVHHSVSLAVAPAKACDREEDGNDIVLRAQMDRLSEKVDALRMPKAGVLICNFLNNEIRPSTRGVPEKEHRARDRSYVQLMMEMLAQHGGGPIHLGRAACLGSAETGAFNDGEWRQCACVYYPGCAFFSQLMRSEWMWRVVKYKSPGESIAVVTVPFHSASTDSSAATATVAKASNGSSDSGPIRSIDTGLHRRKPATARSATSSDSLTEAGTDAEPKLVSVPFLAICQLVVGIWLFRRYM
jgi:hypothetical protein